uniref:Reverse transcriptase domain-containing protein n=1 Tax=Tanacetum cinerariifolium TaxID=118510 RepID=A0A6L2JAM4_TANCI|nr:reverse transcriptase domain-containing protein [Tanacetum cinerariifolium]
MGVLQIGTRAMVIENKEISPKDTKTYVSPSSSVGSSSLIRMPPKRTSTSETPAITLATIQRLITDVECICPTYWDRASQQDHLDRIERLLTNKYRPRTEIKKMEDEFYDLTVKGSDLKTYIRRFQELATLCLNMVPNIEKLMEAFIGGLPKSIEGNVIASKPQNLEDAINIAKRLMDQIIKHNSTQDTNDHKQKFDDKNTTDNKNYPNDCDNHFNNHNNNQNNRNHNNNNHNHNHHQQQNGRQETSRTYAATNGYTGNNPLCERCTLHHIGPRTIKCQNCNRVGHLTKNYRNKRAIIGNNL